MLRNCSDPSLIEQCVNRVLLSDCFARSPQARRFLRYVVEQSSAGRGQSLKAYTIGVSALGVNTERSCPETTARMQASRVRQLLSKYYQLEGKDDPIELTLPSGVYEPRFLHRSAPVTARSLSLKVQIGPFESLTTDPIDTQLCRGLSEALVGRLVVCDHISVVRHEELLQQPANYALSGTVTRGGRSVRLSCHLQNAEEGETVWSDRFDQVLDADNLLSVQDEIAGQLACRIGDPAVGAVARFARRAQPGPFQQSHHAGVDDFFQFLAMPSLNNLQSAQEKLAKCLASSHRADALTHAAYSCCLSLSYVIAPATQKSDLIAAEAHAKSAVVQDSTCALAHLAKALVYYHYRESACALRELGRCVELNELCTTVHAASALLMVLMGSHQQGLRLMDETRRKASHLPGYFYAAYSLYYLHEVGDAKRALGYAERLDLPNAFWTDLLSAACLSRLGSTAEARSFASRVAAADPIFAKRPEKRLSEIFYSENLSEFLAATLSDAGLGPPPSSKRNPPAYRVSLKQRSLPSEIRVGILHSLSGTMALSESHLVNAALLAIEEINQSGGVLGRPVRGLVKDGASDAHTFGRCARKLVEQDGVTSIFGCWTSSSRKAVLPVVEQEDALLWYPLQYEGLEKSKHIIYTGSCLNQQIEPAVRWALKRQRRNCYLIGSDYVFPRTANRLIRALVESGGGQVMGEGYQQLGRADFEAVAQDIRRLKPEIVYNTVNGAENVSLMQALARAGVHPKDTPVMSFSLSELELAQCGSLAQGHLACWSYFQSLDTPKNRELVLRFRQRYGQAEVLSDPAVTAYSQVHLWRKVVESARSLETKEVLAHLTGCTLELGDEMCEMLPNHHVTRRAVIGEIQDGQFRVVWSSAQPIAPQPWLGVDQGEFFSRDLILGALQALPEMAERSSVLSQQIDGRALDATGRNA